MTAIRTEPLNAFTVDVEDYFHVTGFEQSISRRRWSTYESRFEYGVQRLLELLEQGRSRATFYVLGWLARRHPALLRRIAEAGHELGSHSYWHRQVFRLAPRVFRADLRRSLRVIEDAIGRRITAYRAPSFSITKQSLWALEILAEEGVESDSSIAPCRHHRYGIPSASLDVHRIHTPSGTIWELPPAVHRCGRINIPVGGGGYFRLYPFSMTSSLLQKFVCERRPFTFYVHPWELDPEQPRLRSGTRMDRMRHYLKLSSTEQKLVRLLGNFRFGRVTDVIRAADADPVAPDVMRHQLG